MAPQSITHTPNLTLSAAQKATNACMSKANALNIPMNIAVVDNSLHLVSFARMPSAKLTSIDIAINKAYTAAGHRVPTHMYKENVWPGGAAYGINQSNGGRFMVIGGGVPVTLEDGTIVGAIGCSTGTPDQDRTVAEAGVEALREAFKDEMVHVKAGL
ncbi:MAG: hypothetical protein M1831_004542 [Alyxoria varia]|nr:MAG: hypothetical protein M1831_004542 [Alyxoria varia]